MAKRRMLSRRISHSKKVNSLTLKAQLIYTWTIPYLDDFGCYLADSEDVKSEIFPKNKRITAANIKDALIEIQSAKLIIIYDVRGKLYQKYYSFESFQTFKGDRKRIHVYPDCNGCLDADGFQWIPMDSLSKVKVSKRKVIEDKLNTSTNTSKRLDNPTITFRAESEALLFYSSLCKIIKPRNQSDRTCFKNLSNWLALKVNNDKYTIEIFQRVLDYAQEAKGAKNPAAAFISLVKKELSDEFINKE
jgi:hypothetical protein